MHFHLSGTNCESLIHKLGCLKPHTTRNLLDVATNHASGEEAVEAVSSRGRDKGKPKRTDLDEGPSTQRGKKNREDRRRTDDTALIAVADRATRQPQQGLPNHFNKLMDGPYPNHNYPVNHLYKNCQLLKRLLR